MFKLLIVLISISINCLSSKEIKFAVLAPEGSTWMNLMRELDEEIKKETDGKLSFRIYPGGISGDEIDVIRKMNLGSIDSTGFTGVGLGQILPSVRILELPRLFTSQEEIDYVVKKLTPDFEKEFLKKGYILLGWAEVGFVNIFSNKKIESIKDLNGLKMWAWEGDPLVKELFSKLKIMPNEMAVTDVYTSLQTGLIDSVYISPLAAIALQWFTRTKYMNTLKLTNATGAILISKKAFNKLNPENQTLLKNKFKSFSEKIKKASRDDNEKAYITLKDHNIIFTELDKESLEEFDKISKEVWASLAGKLYSEELLKKVKEYKEEFAKKEKIKKEDEITKKD